MSGSKFMIGKPQIIKKNLKNIISLTVKYFVVFNDFNFSQKYKERVSSKTQIFL